MKQEEKYKEIVGKSYNEKEYAFFKEHFNDFVNLELLSPKDNVSKLNKTLERWLSEEDVKNREDICCRHLIHYETIDDVKLCNFSRFYKRSAQKICDKFCEIFDIKKFNI